MSDFPLIQNEVTDFNWLSFIQKKIKTRVPTQMKNNLI